MASVCNSVALPGHSTYPRTVGVLEGVACEGMTVGVCECVLNVAGSLIGVGRTVERSVVAYVDPLVDSEVDLRTEIVLVVFVGSELEDTFAEVHATG